MEALVKLNLERNVEGKKKSFSKYINSKGKNEGKYGPTAQRRKGLNNKGQGTR